MNMMLIIPIGMAILKVLFLQSSSFLCIPTHFEESKGDSMLVTIVTISYDLITLLTMITLAVRSMFLINKTARQACRKISRNDILYVVHTMVITLTYFLSWLLVTLHMCQTLIGISTGRNDLAWLVMYTLQLKSLTYPIIYSLSPLTSRAIAFFYKTM